MKSCFLTGKLTLNGWKFLQWMKWLVTGTGFLDREEIMRKSGGLLYVLQDGCRLSRYHYILQHRMMSPRSNVFILNGNKSRNDWKPLLQGGKNKLICYWIPIHQDVSYTCFKYISLFVYFQRLLFLNDCECSMQYCTLYNSFVL